MASFFSNISLRPARLPPARLRAFTLIELLLVVAIIGIASSIALPSFVRSIRFQRLNSAARMLGSVVRYARSMAVLKQSDLAIEFNLGDGTLQLEGSNASLPVLYRKVDHVGLQEVTIRGEDPVTDGICRVPFMQNGVCAPFEMKIGDDDGSRMVLKVDALGGIKAESGDGP